MKRLPAAMLVAAAAFTVQLHAQCNLALRSMQNGDGSLYLEWNRISGVRVYEVRESRDNFRTSTSTLVFTTSYPIARRASSVTRVSYRVTAQFEEGVLAVQSKETCTDELEVILSVDPSFRRTTRRAVIPIGGGGSGAGGSRFSTSIEMTATAADQRGRLVLHPFGQVASASDPYVAYKFEGVGHRIVYEDIARSLGVDGFGSIDIVPDDDAAPVIPSVRVRASAAAQQGSYGGYVPVVYPYDYLKPQAATIPIEGASFRTNIGARTFSGVALKVLVYGSSGRLRAIRDLELPADFSVLKDASEFIGEQLFPGDRVVILPEGSLVMFYTSTQAGTNDPSVVVLPPKPDNGDVGSYVQ